MRLSARAQSLSSHGAILFAALALLIVMRRLTRGNFLNSYQFISPDGFDWISEGVYLNHLLADGVRS